PTSSRCSTATAREAPRRLSWARTTRASTSATRASLPTTRCSRSRACRRGRAATTTRRPRSSACTHQTSPGLTNSWPKWGPTATATETKTYYWLTFSSVRVGGHPQLFVAPLVVEGGTLTSYPALYLWNQPAGEANHTPAWDLFQIAPIIN